MRKYALVIFDDYDTIIDRFNLDLVTNPTGNGFKLKMSLIEGDVEDIITKVVQEKSSIKFTVNQHLNPYQKSITLKNWIQKYTKPEYVMVLEYDDGIGEVHYVEGKVVLLSKSELDEYGVLAQDFEFKPTTPSFVKRENIITIQKSSTGKSYPFRYPYCYGKSEVTNNSIENVYVADVPILLRVNGAIQNPTFDLLDENGDSYSRVQFNNVVVSTGETLVINSAQRKIFKIGIDGRKVDFVPEVNPSFDTFLRAQSGKSTLSVNLGDTADGFLLKGSWRQYTL